MGRTESEIYVFIITGMLLLAALATLIVYFIISYRNRQRRNEKEKELLRIKFNEDLLNSKIEIQEKSFEDISRELHDNVGQQLAAAHIYLNMLTQAPENLEISKVISCRDIIADCLQDVRSISNSLLGEKVHQVGLIGSIKREVAKINKLGFCQATLEAVESTIKLDPKKEIILFRIIQEGISNAIKHAECKNIHITITKLNNLTKIVLADDGKGFVQDNKPENGIGLLNMKSRAQTVGAQYTLTSQPDLGTQIQILFEEDKHYS